MILSLPKNETKRKWFSIGITVTIALALSVWEIYGNGQYGFALFVCLPTFLSATPVILYGKRKNITFKKAWEISFSTLFIYLALLIVCAIEGMICIAMVAPLAFIVAWISSWLAYLIVNKSARNSSTVIILLLLAFPTMSFIERNSKTELFTVTTSIEINADPHTVWKNVVQFPQLDEPTEFLFKTGISYPINATIKGNGVGAIRYCNFTTGSFVEPITVWNEDKLLQFDVEKQPIPMKEMSFWDIDAPHLHDYFISTKGQFKLTKLKNGNTLLVGTTWYYNSIKPSFYWKLWSDYILHSIHNRVLKHIKKTSEK